MRVKILIQTLINLNKNNDYRYKNIYIYIKIIICFVDKIILLTKFITNIYLLKLVYIVYLHLLFKKKLEFIFIFL